MTEKRSLSSWQLLFLLSCVGQGMSLAVFAAEQTVTGVALVLSFVCLIWLTGAEVMQESA